MAFFQVSGYKPVLGQTKQYFIADSDSQVMQVVKNHPVEEGGFVNYSIQEIEELPIDLNILCPSCNHEFVSPDRVTDLCT